MSEPKRMSDEQYDAHADGNVLMSDFAAIYNEGLRSRAREKRLEGRLREMVDTLRQGHSIEPGSILHEAARAALSEET